MTPSISDILDRLAESVEAAKGPDRELDRAIELANFPARVSPPVELELLAYTSSLDAAMTLVDGCGVNFPKLLASALSALSGRGLDGTQILASEWTGLLARSLTAACLRAAASKARAEQGHCSACGDAGFLENQGSPEQRIACPECEARTDGGENELCDDCPPVGYPTDKTRCLPCPRRGRVQP